MLSKRELNIMRSNAKIHKNIFNELKKQTKPGIRASYIDKLCGDMCKKAGVLAGFKGVYGFPSNICISLNDVVVHGVPKHDIIFNIGDVVTFDFGVKDKKYGINTDSAFTIIVGDGPHNPKIEKFLEINKQALYKGIKQAKVGNTVGDIGHAIEKHVVENGFLIVKDLTGHGIGKKLHEEPYIYNYGKPGKGPKLKKGMTLAIEPITGFTSGEIIDKGDWEIYIADGSLGCQFEHTILITDGEAEIII